jgi:hypothetical protein
VLNSLWAQYPMKIPADLLLAFPPSADLLLDLARRQVDDAMLKEIADADHKDDRVRHLAALRQIREQGRIPIPPEWHPGEVLKLISWSDPEHPAHKPGSTGRRGHQMRAFACAALLRDRVEGEDTLAQCLASARALGTEMSEAAGRFLTWGIPLAEGYERWLFPLGLLIIATRFQGTRVADRTLGETAAWVMAEEYEARREMGPINASDSPPSPFGLSWGFWKPLAIELLENAATVQTADVRSDLKLLATYVRDFII